MTRAEKIKKRLFEVEYVTKKEWWGMNETILTNDAIKKEPLVVRKALGIEYVMRNMPAEIKPDELIVGIATMAATGLGYEFPDYALPEEKEEALRSCYTFKSVWGHHPGDYEKLLRVGVKGLREEIYAKLREEAAKPGCDAGKIDYYRAMLISINSLNDLSYRYAQLTLDEAAKTVDSVRRQELLTISEICNRVPENPASSLHEALQSVFFMMCALQSTLEIVPLGRVDQYLYPYYKHDLETGVLTKEQAEELIVSWLAKFSERVQTNPEFFEANHETALDQSDGGDPENYGGSFAMENDKDYNFGTSANHFLLNMILGGQNPDGTDATNDLTYLLLEQWAYLEAIVPVCSVRLHKNHILFVYARQHPSDSGARAPPRPQPRPPEAGGRGPWRSLCLPRLRHLLQHLLPPAHPKADGIRSQDQAALPRRPLQDRAFSPALGHHGRLHRIRPRSVQRRRPV